MLFKFLKTFFGIEDPKTIDYSQIIEVGDTIGVDYAGNYVEAVVTAILESHTWPYEKKKYVLNIIRDEHPSYFNDWTGRTKIIDLTYDYWTILKKHVKPVCDKDNNLICNKK